MQTIDEYMTGFGFLHFRMILQFSSFGGASVTKKGKLILLWNLHKCLRVRDFPTKMNIYADIRDHEPL